MKQTRTILTLNGLFMLLVPILLSKPTMENFWLYVRIVGTMPLNTTDCLPLLIRLQIRLLCGLFKLGMATLKAMNGSFITNKQMVSWGHVINVFRVELMTILPLPWLTITPETVQLLIGQWELHDLWSKSPFMPYLNRGWWRKANQPRWDYNISYFDTFRAGVKLF